MRGHTLKIWLYRHNLATTCIPLDAEKSGWGGGWVGVGEFGGWRLGWRWVGGWGLGCGTKRFHTVYPKKYAHGFCFAVLCCGYTLTDFPISTRLTSLALWQSNDCPSASKATLMNMDRYFMWIHYERLHNHNKVKHNKTVCVFLGIYFKYPLHASS